MPYGTARMGDEDKAVSSRIPTALLFEFTEPVDFDLDQTCRLRSCGSDYEPLRCKQGAALSMARITKATNFGGLLLFSSSLQLNTRYRLGSA
jgi:hypothetical protein